ncbi:hypothetical protein WJX74_004714 [Apatococcus lobatus]|uniref:Uncharacterized protein n=1 Tax=Apatococcus lobatus TaxID=904363 RepID=A0AAW1QZY2_9CHLO
MEGPPEVVVDSVAKIVEEKDTSTTMDGLVDHTKLPIGTIFKGYCTAGDDLAITRSRYEDGAPHYDIEIYQAQTGTIEGIYRRGAEDSDIDMVYRPRAGRASYVLYTAPDSWNDGGFEEEGRLFKLKLAKMKAVTGVDWLAEAAEPALWKEEDDSDFEG